MTNTYKFQSGFGRLSLISDHMDALDIEVLTMVRDGDEYTISTDKPIPEDQLEHLELEIV